ncbi:MAG: tetratricopeptide repeat protein [Candidatus Saliniplasma sp.]
MSALSGETKDKDKLEFVNRNKELDELKEFVDQVKEGKGKTVLLKGEAGVGKTKLAERLEEICKKEGFQTFRGRCLYHEGTEPFLPLIDALGEYIDEEKGIREEPSYIGMGANTAASNPGKSIGSDSLGMVGVGTREKQDTDGISLSDKREAMFTDFLDLINDLSLKSPVFIFIDDLQWIDVSSSQLLHFLSRKIYNSKVFLIGAFRPEELKTREEELPIETILERMKEEKLVDVLDVERLGFQPVANMIKDFLRTKDLPESFLLMVYRESEGNPYYVIEILNSMMDEGVIDPYSYNWDPEEELSDISIPSSIKDITNRRIERLSKKEKNVLMYASVIGTEFDFELLENAMDMDVIELLDIIEGLQFKDMIREKEGTDEEMYRFNHLQIRTSIYNNMGKSRKRVLNNKIGEAIETFYEDNLEEHYYSLSRHFYEGKVYDKAYEYSIKAAGEAINRYAIETALEHYERAVRALDKTEDVEDIEQKKIEHLKRIGELSFDINMYERGKDSYRSVIEISKGIGDKKVEADAIRGLAHINKEDQEFEKADRRYERALKIYEDIDDLAGIADCRRGLGYIRWREGNFDEAVENYQTAIEKGKKVGDDNILALTYIEMGNTYGHQGENDIAIRYYVRSLPILRSQNAFRDLARANNNIGDQYMKKEEWDEAIEYFNKSIENAKKIGNKRYVGWGYFNQAEALAKKGDLERAKEYTDRSEKLMKSLDDVVGLSSVFRAKGIIFRIEENYDEAIKWINKSKKLLDGYDIPFNFAENYFELGRIHEDMGRYDEAMELYEEAKEKFPDEAMQYIEKIDSRMKDLNV